MLAAPSAARALVGASRSSRSRRRSTSNCSRWLWLSSRPNQPRRASSGSALIAREEIRVPLAHLPYPRRHVAVDLIAQHLFHHRQHILGESRPARHPLVVVAAAVAVGPVQPRAREAALQPAE